MKLRLAPSNLASRLHHPLRFGRVWRGHELLLRIVQLALLVLLAGVGARLIANGVTEGFRSFSGFLS